MFLTINLEVLVKIALVAYGLVIWQVIQDLLGGRAAVLVFGAGLFPSEMEYGIV